MHGCGSLVWSVGWAVWSAGFGYVGWEVTPLWSAATVCFSALNILELNAALEHSAAVGALCCIETWIRSIMLHRSIMLVGSSNMLHWSNMYWIL